MIISTAICISLNFLQVFEFPEKAPVVFIYADNISLYFLSSKTTSVCKWNKKSHATVTTYFGKYCPACFTVMTTDEQFLSAVVFFLRIGIILNILYNDYWEAAMC